MALVFAERFKPSTGDLIAGVSVAMILLPQSLAYAELAGLPAYIGLYAAAFPLLIAAFTASSPYLQTGPVAVTSLLTISAMPQVPAEQLPGLAALMALYVGLFRIALGALKAGRIIKLMPSAVVMGFTSGATFIILCSQLPKTLGFVNTGSGFIQNVLEALKNIQHANPQAVAFSLLTVTLFVGGKRIHRLFPGVLIAVLAGIVISALIGYQGPKLDNVPSGFPPISFDLPWQSTTSLLVPAAVIALIGFAEPASIARTYADETGEDWSANQELVSSGATNIVAAFTGGYPVGGSFSRSALNRLAGATTPLSGGITGLVVLAVLPWANLFEPLPIAVLGAIVCAAVIKLIRPQDLFRIVRRSPIEALLGWTTAASVLIFAPRIERAVIIGVVLSVAVHFIIGLKVKRHESASRVTLKPVGFWWTGSASRLHKAIAAEDCDKVIEIDLADIAFVDQDLVQILRQRCNRCSSHRVVMLNPPPNGAPLLATVISD